MRIRSRFLTLLCALLLSVQSAFAADREKVAAFVDVIGFDVMLSSLVTSARNAPSMLGIEAQDFGSTWVKLVETAFEQDQLEQDALDILAATLSDDLLQHGADFYASDLGQRLVEAENTSHLADRTLRGTAGAALVAELEANNPDRLVLFENMSAAVGSQDSAVRAVIELQVRFLTAAADAGIVRLRLKPAELRARLEDNVAKMREDFAQRGLISNAWTYRDFSDADVAAYVNALKAPEMQLIYQLLSATQFEMQVTRYEDLARQLAAIFPGQDL